ncbi:Uma2 family endonuclease [Actinomadura rubrisoli]|uniref:Uma2 family endonuclease n=1 Tax=Actinomadura rubrisoli TaxID=2530368 RepID=UPI0014042DFB|nr:Uma2 family endonuclease [Actinomadura rubrisoli]
MSIVATSHHHHELPDTPYNLWTRDELADLIDLPHDGTRVEIIGGEIVVSPGPDYAHNAIIRTIQKQMFAAELANPAYPWRCITTQDVVLSEIHDGYIPDLCFLSKKDDREARETQIKKLSPRHLALAVEVTSPGNARNDRRPGPGRSGPTKWSGYARVGVPYYLLVERDPAAPMTTLFTCPDTFAGVYEESVRWRFGDEIRLPKPFGLVIPTDEWEPWQRGQSS